MADVRKNEEIKVVKNPLLRQNFLLEEISGISFIVPPVSERLEVEDHGSSEGLEVPQVGVKRDGKAQETLSFTDIPLDVPETSEDSNPPPLPSAAKQEGSSFGLRSIIPSFVPLLVPQSFKQNTSQKEPETKSLFVENQAIKRVTTPETVVPQLVTPPSLESITQVPTFPGILNKEVFSPVPSPIVPVSVGRPPSVLGPPPIAAGRPPSVTGSAHLVATPPPPVTGPPPLASNINRIGSANPYALKRSHLPSSGPTPKSNTNEYPYFVPHAQSPLNSFPSDPQVSETSVGLSHVLPPSVSNSDSGASTRPYIFQSSSTITSVPVSATNTLLTNSTEKQQAPSPIVPPSVLPITVSHVDTSVTTCKNIFTSEIFNSSGTVTLPTPNLNEIPSFKPPTTILTSSSSATYFDQSAISPPSTNATSPFSKLSENSNDNILQPSDISNIPIPLVEKEVPYFVPASTNTLNTDPGEAPQAEVTENQLPSFETNISTINFPATEHSNLSGKDSHSVPSSILANAPLIPPPVSTVFQPPPVANINRARGSNPYTLKNSQHPSPFNSKPDTVPHVNSSTFTFFSPSNQTSCPSGPFNILSGPQISSSSTTGHQLKSIDQPDKNTESSKLETHSVAQEVQNVPLVQSFTSAISNFISPNKPSSGSSLDNISKGMNPPVSSLFYNTESQPSPISSTVPQGQFIQIQSDINSIQENPVPQTAPFFNTSNPINKNIIGVNSFGLPPSHSTDNTVCVSSITSALSSVAPASGISTNPLLTVTSPYTTQYPPQNSISETIPTATPPELHKQQSFINNNINQNQQTLSSINSNLFNNNITDNQVQAINSVSNNLTNSNQSAASVNFIEPVNNAAQLHLQPTGSLNKSGEGVTSTLGGLWFNPNSVKEEGERKRTDKGRGESRGNVPVIQPIPTFNYFSSSQGTCLPPPLEPSSQTKQAPQLPTSSFFKPIEAPNFPTGSLPPQNQTTTQPYQISTHVNPIPTPTQKITFPPPNIAPMTPAVSKIDPKTEPPIKSDPKSEKIEVEELEQIPLEGSAVPLYKPDYHPRIKQEHPPGEVGNSYRLGGGLKKPTYAPVPELGVTGKKSYPTEASPSNSLSSQEEMAAIEAQSSRATPPQSPPGNTSPSNSTSLDAYYTNQLQAPCYRPPYHHWFFKSGQHKKSPWTPFSMADSMNLEQVYTSSELTEGTKVPTDGGRYDVEIVQRKKTSVYWEENPGEVRRCAWFVKSATDSRYTPYDENIAALLEDEYKMGCECNEWNRRIELADGEVIILHSPTAMAHHVRSSSPDTWGAQTTLQQKPRAVKRGVEDFNIAKGEPKQVDHLLLMVHGVGKACDLRFRSLVEVVDDFRSIAQQLVGSHFHSGVENGNVGRVEILPVEWHGALHTETINDRLSAITLPSIPRAREFTNETLLDILFYTSPVFAEVYPITKFKDPMNNLGTPAYNTRSKAVVATMLDKEVIPASEVETIVDPMGHSTQINIGDESFTESDGSSNISANTHLGSVIQGIEDLVHNPDHERIVQAVGEELNRVYTLYKSRNPGFRGQISLGGHSLGSLILFDILCNQKMQRPHLSTQSSLQSEEDESLDELGCLQKSKVRLSRRMSYLTIGPGTGQPYSNYPQLQFQPRSFFALGSPIGMFVTVRGLDSLGEDFRFPTCPAFFNIFHPNDPVAYRIEALIKPEMATVPAVLIPHHKGRKRMHLELKETMTHVTAALKQKLVDSMKNTWNAVYHLTLFNRKDNSLQGDVNKVIEDEVLRDLETDPPLSVVGEEGAGSDVKVGKLNAGRRVDYVLQEAPLETFNQYISAIRSHLVYWESEDTTLMILKEIYGGMGISPDSQVPQPILPFDITGDSDSFSDYTYSIGALPTQFIRK